MNTFSGIKLSETGIFVGKMLLPWQKMGILTCIDNRLNLEQILNLDQLIELYVYAAVYNFSKGEEAVMKRVWQNIQSAKTFSEYDQSTIENKRNYTGSGIHEVTKLIMDGKEVYGFVDNAYRVQFYKQSQLLIMLIANPRRFLGVHGVWINLTAMLHEYARIRFQKKKGDDRILMEFRKIYRSLAKGIAWVRKSRNPSTEKIIELIKEPNSEIKICTNNQGRVTSIEHGYKKKRGG